MDENEIEKQRLHDQRQRNRTFTEAEVRDIVAKAYERCADNLDAHSGREYHMSKMYKWAADIRSGKENLE